MSLEVSPFAALDFPVQEQTTEIDLANEGVFAVDSIAKTITHVDPHDRNDPLGYYGSLLDDTKGDVRAASRELMDRMISHRLF